MNKNKSNIFSFFLSYLWFLLFLVNCGKTQLLINPENNPLESHKDIVIKVKFSQDGKYLASGGNDSDIILWDGRYGKYLRTLKGDYDKIFDISFIDSRHEIITANYQGTILTWDDHKGLKKTDILDKNSVTSFDFYYPGGFFVASSWETSLKVLKLDDYSVIYTCKSEDFKIRTVKYSEKTKSIYAGTASGHMLRWDFERCTDGAGFNQSVHKDALTSLDINDELNILVTSSSNGEVKLFNLNTLKETGVLKGHKSSVNSVKIIPQLMKIASADKDGRVFLWDIKSQSGISFIAHVDSINTLDISPDGQLLASGSSDHTVKIWNLGKIISAAK